MLKYLFFILIIFLAGCDKGIAPVSEETQQAGFSGTINFIGTWPDSVKRTHIVVFKDPLNSAADFNAFNLRYVSLDIPFGTRVFNYSSLDSALVPQTGQLQPGEYSYVAVAQSSTPQISLNRQDWVVVGLYTDPNDSTKPGKLIIPNNTLVRGINITCDFNNPPPQPPGGN